MKNIGIIISIVGVCGLTAFEISQISDPYLQIVVFIIGLAAVGALFIFHRLTD
jgi:hypothetical protein